MLTITATQFKLLTTENPAWASTLIEPIEITGDASLTDSPITHLSPLLRFTQTEKLKFKNCKSLLNAAGETQSAVKFENCGIQSIHELKINTPNNALVVATFKKCYELADPTGIFPGPVRFKKCGLKTTNGLVIKQGARYGSTLVLEKCQQLETLEGVFPGPIAVYDCSFKTTENLEIIKNQEEGFSAHFENCPHWKNAEGNFYTGIRIITCGIETINGLKIQKPRKILGTSAYIENCKKLESVEGEFPTLIHFENCGLHDVKNLTIKNSIKFGSYINKRGVFINCHNIKNISSEFTKENTIFNEIELRPWGTTKPVIDKLAKNLFIEETFEKNKYAEYCEKMETPPLYFEVASFIIEKYWKHKLQNGAHFKPYKICKTLKKKFNFKPSYSLGTQINNIPKIIAEGLHIAEYNWEKNHTNFHEFHQNEIVKITPEVILHNIDKEETSEEEFKKIKELTVENQPIEAKIIRRGEEEFNLDLWLVIKLLNNSAFFKENNHEMYVRPEEIIRIPQPPKPPKETTPEEKRPWSITSEEEPIQELKTLHEVCFETPITETPSAETLETLYKISFQKENGSCFQTWIQTKQEKVFELLTNHLTSTEIEELNYEFNLTAKTLELVQNGIELEVEPNITTPLYNLWGFYKMENEATRQFVNKIQKPNLEKFKKYVLDRWTSAALKQHTLQTRMWYVGISESWYTKIGIQVPIKHYTQSQTSNPELQKLACILLFWEYDPIVPEDKPFEYFHLLNTIIANTTSALTITEKTGKIYIENEELEFNLNIKFNLEQLKSDLEAYHTAKDPSFKRLPFFQIHIEETERKLVLKPNQKKEKYEFLPYKKPDTSLPPEITEAKLLNPKEQKILEGKIEYLKTQIDLKPYYTTAKCKVINKLYQIQKEIGPAIEIPNEFQKSIQESNINLNFAIEKTTLEINHIIQTHKQAI
jgi:hypothetical protein